MDHNHVAERHDTLVMLRLREITITDLGNYTCEAENTQGTARDHIELSGNFSKSQNSKKLQKFTKSEKKIFFKYVFLFLPEFMSHFCIAVGLEQFRGMLFPNKY